MNIRSNFLRIHFLGDNIIYSGSENGDMQRLYYLYNQMYLGYPNTTNDLQTKITMWMWECFGLPVL